MQSNGEPAEVKLSVGAHFRRDQQISITSFQLWLCIDNEFGSCKPSVCFIFRRFTLCSSMEKF